MFGANKETPVALGFTAREWVDMLNTKEASAALKSLAYYDGQQEEELIKVLNVTRKNWRQKHLTPRFRNITKMVVEKSGMIFKDSAPKLAIFDADQVVQNSGATELLYELFSKEEYAEFWSNFDEVLRLLKTALVLIQWDAEEQKFIPDILHRGNCEVVLSPINRKLLGMIYRVADNMYQIWTPEEIIELTEAQQSIAVTGRDVNPYGVIPATVFYDTNTPRVGFWVEQDKSLVNLNEMVNLHLTDSEYSLLWSKMSTLFTNMRPAGDGSAQVDSIETYNPTRAIPQTPRPENNPAYLAGPGSAVVLDSMGVDNPFVRYENPNINLKPLNEVVDNWVKSVAGDWSVNIRAQGEGRAESGFQLIVEEMDNFDLRRKRQKMFESGFKRMYRVIRAVYNTAIGVEAFPADSQLFAEFEKPVLPVDYQQQEIIWTTRINEFRGTEIDYFQAVEGISREEAEKRFLEIVEFNKKKKALLADLQPQDKSQDNPNGTENPQDTNAK